MKKILFMMSVALTVSAYAQIPTDSLVLYLPFNGNANDVSGIGNHGTVMGATLTTDRFGTSNSAYSFDGVDDYIKIDGNYKSDKGTFAAWVNIKDYEYNPIIAFNDTSVSNSGFRFSINKLGSSHPKKLQFLYDDRGCGGSLMWKDTQDTLLLNSWYFVTLTNDSILTKLYINGNLSVVDTSTPSPNNWTNSHCSNFESEEIGRWKRVGNLEHFFGDIDDVRIYNRVLDSLEITSLYNEGLCFQTVYDTTQVYDTTFVTVTDTTYDTTYLSVTDTLIINAVLTGVSPPNNTNTIKIYPNPANTYITIDNGNYASMSGYSVEIKNSLGQIVFSSPVNQQQFFLDLSTWSGNGLYYYYLSDNTSNIIEVKKIVLE